MSTTFDFTSFKKTLDAVNTKSGLHKIIIGIDYGTTFSGVSYVTTDKTGIDDITVISSWPGDNFTSWKTPTRIAYSQENPRIKGENKWGFEVSPKLISYSWTKLLLDQHTAVREHDDPSLSSIAGAGMLKLPPFRDAAGVCEDFLREVYAYASAKLRQQMTDNIFETTPMECWVTLPAVWSEEAKDATLKAAQNAGFGKRPGDKVFTIAEPEAAAIASLKGYSKAGAMNPIVPNENILICDCGGGTIDITTYTIVQVQPYLTFDELCVGIGGKCGSTYIDRNLHSLLSKRFGSAFDDLPFGQKGPGSRFMSCFETLKRDFGYGDDQDELELGPITLDVPESEYYDEDERIIKLTYEDMQSLFDPVVTEITNLIEQQVKAAKKVQNATINRIILVGGFGESRYLNKMLGKWCKENGNIPLICPMHPQSAIVRGAALRGFEGIAPRVKRLRCHYGIRVRCPFREGIDPEEQSCFGVWNNEKMCENRMVWLISKGETVTEDTSRVYDLCREYTPGKDNWLISDLFACISEDAPDYYYDPGVEVVGTIESTLDANFDFRGSTRSKYNNKLGRVVHQLEFQHQIVFGNKGDNLTSKILIGGKEHCKAAIKFNH